METLDNGIISIAVKKHGAELASLKYKGREYLWQADGEFWARHSPVLFPIVGNVWNKEFRSHGKVYPMGQHGFARDMDFELISKSGNEIWYRLTSSEATLEKYPYPFVLEIGYRLGEGCSESDGKDSDEGCGESDGKDSDEGCGESDGKDSDEGCGDSRLARTIEVMWRVYNSGEENMSFQIGAHPAFHWPLLSDKAIAGGTQAMKQELANSTDRGYFRLGLNGHRQGVISDGISDGMQESAPTASCDKKADGNEGTAGRVCDSEKVCGGEKPDGHDFSGSGNEDADLCRGKSSGFRIAKSVIGAGGCFDETLADCDILDKDGMLHIDTASFDRDALVYENSQVNAVTLCTEDRTPYLTLSFDTPVVGLWSSPGKNAPFVCIEPWYGRADSVGFTGGYEEKPWINCIAPGDTFAASYTITIE